MEQKKEKNGFTLLEILIVVTMFGILAAIIVFELTTQPVDSNEFTEPNEPNYLVVSQSHEFPPAEEVEQEEKEYNLWFSEKQKKWYEKTGRDKIFGLLESGEVVEYTEAVSVQEEPISLWDDLKYLGVGRYHHSGSYYKKTK